MTFGPGSVIAGRYHADRLVGAGGMGEVWAGELVEAGQKVALKRLLPAASQHHEVVARFRREAVLLGRIQSDHVARVVDFVDDRAFGPVLVMEFIEGPSLAHVLEDRKLVVEEAIDLVVDLAHALCDLHDAKVVHRDLKPGNIIMRPGPDGRSRAVLVDFGIGRQLANDDAPDEITGITRANIALGTVEYMAPEQILNSREVTPLTDIYAIGAILYRAVAGVHAFGARRGEELARAKLIEDPPKLDVGRKDEIAVGLAEVVARCLKKRPAHRYPSARDLLAEVKRLQDRVRIAELDLDSTTADGSQATRVVAGLAAARAATAAHPTPAAGRPATIAERTDPVPPRMQEQRPAPPSQRGVAVEAPRVVPAPAPSGAPAVPHRSNPADVRASVSDIRVSGGGAADPRMLQADPRASISDVRAVQPNMRASMPSIADGRASMPSIGDGRASMPAIPEARAPMASIPEGRAPMLSIPEGRPPMASIPDLGPASRMAEPARPRGVGMTTVLLAVLTAFAVGAALGLVVAPSNEKTGGSVASASASVAAAPACPVCPAEKACPAATEAAIATQPSASAQASAAPTAKPLEGRLPAAPTAAPAAPPHVDGPSPPPPQLPPPAAPPPKPPAGSGPMPVDGL